MRLKLKDFKTKLEKLDTVSKKTLVKFKVALKQSFKSLNLNKAVLKARWTKALKSKA